MEEEAIKYYEYFYNKVNDSRFEVTRSERQLKIISNFLKLFGERSQEDLYEFICFQFSRVHKQDTEIGKIQLNWIFGKKALTYWKGRDETQIYFMRVFKQKYKVKNTLKPKVSINTGSYHNNERLRFFNKNRGYLHCQEIGNSFRESNSICLKCKFNNICKIN